MKHNLRCVLFSLLVGPALVPSAMATPLTAVEVLEQFNLVVTGNAVSSSEVDGRVYVGGQLTGGGYVQHPGSTPASAYAGLTVGGSVSSVNVNAMGVVAGGNLSNANVNGGFGVVGGNANGVNFNGGPAYVGGNVNGVNFNGGRVADLATSPLLQSAHQMLGATDFGAVMSAYSHKLSLIGGTGSTVTINGGKAIFNAVANPSGWAVFDLTKIDTQVFSLGEFEFNMNGATNVLFNTDESSYRIGANFLAGSAANIAKYTIWNFYNATDLQMGSQFGGVVLAPHAHLTNWNNIEGSVVVGSLTQYGEIHQQGFFDDPYDPGNRVPEPATLALVLLGVGLAARRRGSRLV